jgi:hypothetical protein
MYYRLADRTQCVPNGFIVRIKQVRAEARFWDFNSAVNWYVNFAQANPNLGLPTDWNEAAVVVDLQNAARVAAMWGTAAYVVAMEGDAPIAVNASLAPSVKTCCGAKKKP